MNFMEKLSTQHKAELVAFLQQKNNTAEEISRVQGILLVSEGVSAKIIEDLTGLKKTTIVKIRKKYIKQGIITLLSNRKEKQFRSLLTKQQRVEIAEMLHSQTPCNYARNCDYWTPNILAAVILEKYGVKYKSKSSIHLIFKQSKFTFHKPEKIYERRNQEVITKWKENNTEIVQKILADEETVLLVADEMIITSQTTTQRIWLPEGYVPLIECANVRKRKSFYGFLDIKTGRQIAFKTEKQTSEISAKILKQVLDQYKNKKVVLFWDNAPWHKGEAMRNFLDTCTNFLIINFPPYAPDENPQEHVWKALRANITHNAHISDIDKTARHMLEYLNNTTFKYKFFGFTAN